MITVGIITKRSYNFFLTLSTLKYHFKWEAVYEK